MDEFRIEISASLDQRLRESAALKAVAMDAAKKIAGRAKDTAPVLTGDYKDQITVQETKNGARVLAQSNKSAWIEFGVPAHNQPAQFILRNAAVSEGYGFEKH